MPQKTVRHRKSDLIWLFDFLSLESLSGEQDYVIFLSERDVNIIYQGLKDVDRFQTRVFVDNEGEQYLTVDDTQFTTWQNWVSDLFNHIGEWRMTNEILERIAIAVELLEEQGCCPEAPGGGTMGAGIFPADPSPQGSSSEDRAGDPPPGFADWSEYDTYKCDIAHRILSDMISDIATTFTLGAGATTAITLATLLVTALLTPIGWAALITLAGLALSLFATGVTIATLTTMMEDNREVLVCGMLSGDDVASSIDLFGDVVDLVVNGELGITALGDVAVFLAFNTIMSYASIDSFNRLYVKVPYEIETGQDCAACGAAEWWSCATAGTLIDFDENSITITAFDTGTGTWVASVGSSTIVDWTISLDSGSLTNPASVPTFKASQDDDFGTACGGGDGYPWTNTYNSWPTSFTTKTWQWRSGSAFTVTASWT
jgi:hypothetical protein